jgi:uncharacterized protein (DUF1778 family)
MTVLKDRSLNIRVTEEEKVMVEQAAHLTHMSMSRFMLLAALRSAEEVLADQTRFVLPSDQWDEFVALLDRPARVLPGLREVASKPSPFADR